MLWTDMGLKKVAVTQGEVQTAFMKDHIKREKDAHYPL